MADEKKEEKNTINIKDLLNQKLYESLAKDEKSGIDPMAIMFAMMTDRQDKPDPMTLMIMMNMMQQMNEKKNSGFDMNQLIQFYMMKPILDDLAGGNKLSPIEEKILASMTEKKDDESAKVLKEFIEFEKHRDEVKQAREEGRSESSKQLEELRNEVMEIANRLSERTSLSQQIHDFAQLKQDVMTAYSMLNPEQKKAIPAPSDEWTAEDYVNAFGQIMDAIPGVVTAIKGVSASIKPPKKPMKETPIVPKAQEPPPDPEVQEYLDPKKWRKEKDPEGKEVWVDPYNQIWLDEQTQNSIGPEDMKEYFAAHPDEAVPHVKTVKENYQKLLEQQAEEQKKKQEEQKVEAPEPAPEENKTEEKKTETTDEQKE